MADGVTVKTNLPDFKKQLQEFGYDMQRRIFRSGVSAAATVFKRLVIQEAPVLRTRHTQRVAGLLKRAVYTKRARDSRNGLEHYFVGVRQGKRAQQRKGGSLDAFYWRFVEGGHLVRRRGQRLRGGRRSLALQRARLGSSGAQRVRPYPFLAPAFRRGKDDALQAFNKRVQARIDKENAKLR
jgi:HK97 gp10 family phage protein